MYRLRSMTEGLSQKSHGRSHSAFLELEQVCSQRRHGFHHHRNNGKLLIYIRIDARQHRPISNICLIGRAFREVSGVSKTVKH